VRNVFLAGDTPANLSIIASINHTFLDTVGDPVTGLNAYLEEIA